MLESAFSDLALSDLGLSFASDLSLAAGLGVPRTFFGCGGGGGGLFSLSSSSDREGDRLFSVSVASSLGDVGLLGFGEAVGDRFGCEDSSRVAGKGVTCCCVDLRSGVCERELDSLPLRSRGRSS
jgi:hypothetical protein